MLRRLRSTWLAGGGAILLTLSMSGIALGAVLVARNIDLVDEPVGTTEGTTDTTLTFEDIDGNGVDDDCQATPAGAVPDAASAALTAADLDHDGTISVSEAAQSDWVGGKNCNHGGYVSSVAKASDDAEDAEDADAEPAACDAPVVEPEAVDESPVDTAPNAHGKAVSKVAKSDAVGGKNCNHGGAVSEAAKKDHADKHGDAAKKDHAAKGQGKDQAKDHGKP
jgi:hypothetical protein